MGLHLTEEMPSLPADGTQWSLGAQEAAEPDVHEPTSWEGAGATDDPNTIVVMGIISLPTGGDVGARAFGGRRFSFLLLG